MWFTVPGKASMIGQTDYVLIHASIQCECTVKDALGDPCISMHLTLFSTGCLHVAAQSVSHGGDDGPSHRCTDWYAHVNSSLGAGQLIETKAIPMWPLSYIEGW